MGPVRDSTFAGFAAGQHNGGFYYRLDRAFFISVVLASQRFLGTLHARIDENISNFIPLRAGGFTISGWDAANYFPLLRTSRKRFAIAGWRDSGHRL